MVSIAVQQILPFHSMKIISVNLSTPFWRVPGPFLLATMIQLAGEKKEDLLLLNGVIPRKSVTLLGISPIKGKLASPGFAPQITTSTDPDFQEFLKDADLTKPLPIPQDVVADDTAEDQKVAVE